MMIMSRSTGRGRRYRRSSRLEQTTLTLLSAMQPPATQGGSCMWVAGYSTPAAMGIISMLYASAQK